ncbi:restriction endonuclease subunit S [Zeaxanthinibacter sp. PT1]|uniref:restriction endonuclease subunit S n=1 Tax=Zeaxanthinibacter TaxID=561554 RepID=UPI00234BD1BE|nr:restriction endonuclease subunit S [Zeaxanthinibacter sp. PT1]MDC6350472.1 restriction endonuclease subunit S [Zeaxanthinibacter sp. PT1]
MREVINLNKENSETRDGFKKTKMGWIPNDWEIFTLKEVLEEYRLGGNYANTDVISDTPLIKMGNVGRGNIITDKIEYLDESQTVNHEDFLKYGDILFNTRNTLELVGKVAIWKNELKNALYNSNLLRLTFNHHVENSFFMNYCLNSDNSLRILRRIATGTTSVAAIYTKDLLKITIPLPPLPEQRKIAEILSTWDEAIDKVSQLIEKLEVRKKGLMQQLLTGKKRLPGFEGEWEEITLGEITERITTKNTELNDNVVTISAQRGFIRQEDFFNKRVASKTLSGYYLIKRGDFAYNKSYSKGYPMGAFKRLDHLDKAVVTTLYICFSLKKNVNSDFLLNYFEGGLLVKNLMKIAQEGGRAHGLLNIGIKDFFNLKLTIPTLKEQDKIADLLNTIDQEINYYAKSLELLQEQKKGLMQQLLTGKTRVKTS